MKDRQIGAAQMPGIELQWEDARQAIQRQEAFLLDGHLAKAVQEKDEHDTASIFCEALCKVDRHLLLKDGHVSQPTVHIPQPDQDSSPGRIPYRQYLQRPLNVHALPSLGFEVLNADGPHQYLVVLAKDVKDQI